MRLSQVLGLPAHRRAPFASPGGPLSIHYSLEMTISIRDSVETGATTAPTAMTPAGLL
jgi:hypothetical protein